MRKLINLRKMLLKWFYGLIWCVLYAVSQLQLLENLWMNDVHIVLSSMILLSSYRLMLLASFIGSIHLAFGLSLFLVLSVFPSIIVFSKEHCFPWCARSRTASVSSFLPPMVLKALLFFMVDRAICRAFFQHHASSDSIFFSIGFSSLITLASAYSNWKYKGVADLSLDL